MALPAQTKAQILHIINSILEGDFQVILFGSYAKGTQTERSDIDLAIKSDAPLDTAKWSLLEEAFEESDILQKVDLVDYHRVKESFQKVIDGEGIQLS